MILKTLLLIALYFGAPRESFWRDVSTLRYGRLQPWEEVTDDECRRALFTLPTHYAYTALYAQSGGSNLNSGSSSTNTVAYSSSSGNWSTVTNNFTPTDGSTPSGTVLVGDWVSIYTGSPTSTGFVAQVTAVAAGANGVITVSTTAIYGTAPTTGSGTFTLKDGGAWADLTGSIPTSTTTVPGSTQININNSFTLSGALTVALKGATTTPLWFRGYNTTPGDLDTGSATLSYPTVTCGANTLNFSGNYIILSGLSTTGSKAGNVFSVGGTEVKVLFCRFAGTGASSTTVAANGTASWMHCYFTCPSTAAVIASIAGHTSYSYFAGAGGSTTVAINAGAAIDVDHCTIYQTGSHGITYASTGLFTVDYCTFYQCGGDSIRINTSIPGTGSHVMGCYFYQSGNGAGTFHDINYNIATVTGNLTMMRNVSNSPSGAHLNGLGDWAETGALSESIFPFFSTTDLRLKTASVGRGAALPAMWESLGVALLSSPDVGAWQSSPPRKVRHRLGMRY